MALKENLTDDQIFHYMKLAINIQDWNTRREKVKAIRGERWIGRYIDGQETGGTALIKLSRINKKEEEV